MKKMANVAFIVLGVMIASYGEIRFVLTGFLFQLGGVLFEAIRLTMVGRLLSSAEFKMDPLVSFYYFAPVCAIMNGIVSIFMEVPRITLEQVAHVGYFTLLLNALIAFGLNASVVFLVSLRRFESICSCSSKLLDWPNQRPRYDALRCVERYSACLRLYRYLGYSSHSSAILRLQHGFGWNDLFQAGKREHPSGVQRGKPEMVRIWCQSPCKEEDPCLLPSCPYNFHSCHRFGSSIRL